MPKVVGNRIENGLIGGVPQRAAFSRAFIYDYVSIRVKISKCASLQSCMGRCRKYPRVERKVKERGRASPVSG